MARVTKSRARTALAEGSLSLSWTSSEGGTYRVGVNNGTHLFSLSMTHHEMLNALAFFAGYETFTYGISGGGMGWSDKRTLPERLRALADKLEQEGRE